MTPANSPPQSELHAKIPKETTAQMRMMETLPRADGAGETMMTSTTSSSRETTPSQTSRSVSTTPYHNNKITHQSHHPNPAPLPAILHKAPGIQRGDAASSFFGIVLGLATFSVNEAEFLGGLIVGFILLLSLSSSGSFKDEHEDLSSSSSVASAASSSSSSSAASGSSSRSLLIIPWGLLWTTFVCLEAAKTKWAPLLMVLYGVYYLWLMFDAEQSRHVPKKMGFAGIVGVLVTYFTATLFVSLIGSKGALQLGLVFHAAWWTFFFIITKERLISLKRLFLYAPLTSLQVLFSKLKR